MNGRESEPIIPQLDEGTLDELYRWLETVPLSRPRRNFARDFSDGVLVAEVIAHFLPRYVDLHGYMPASSTSLKKYNWETLNKKVLVHLELELSEDVIGAIVDLRPGAIEWVLTRLRVKLELAVSQGRFKPRRRNRSRSSGPASRNGSTLSLTSLNYDSDCTSADPPPTASARTPTMHIGPKFVMTAPVEGKEGKVCEDLVPGRVVHGLQQDIIGKSEQISNLQNRVRHLEQTVKLKDERIEQLTQRLDRLAQVFYNYQMKKVTETPTSSDGDLKRWIPTAASNSPTPSPANNASPLHQMAANFRSMLSEAVASGDLNGLANRLNQAVDADPTTSLPANYEFTNTRLHTP